MKFLQKIKSVTAILSVFLLFLVSCKKNTEDLQDLPQADFLVKEQFFKTSNQLSQNLKSIVQKIKKQDSAYNFVPNLVKQIGYPNWEKVLESPRTSINGRLKSSDSSITLIPFNQNNTTTAFLACIQTTDTIYFNLETRNNLFNYNFFTSTNSEIKQKQIAKLAIMANFEKKCNNKDSLLINNTYIKSIKNASINFLNNNSNGRSSGWVTKEIEICYTETVYEPIYPSGDPVGGFHYVERTTCNTYYVTEYTDEYDDPNNPGGNPNGWWNNGSGSGGGSGGGSNTGFSSTVTSLSLQLGLTPQQALWLQQNLEFATLIDQQLTDNDYSEESKTTSKILIDLGRYNLLETAWDVDFASAATPHLESHYSCCPSILMMPNFSLMFTKHTLANYVIIRQDNPGWSKLRCAWEAVQESVHTGLDVAGLIPVIGEVFDIGHGILYSIQGDGLNATLAFAAAVPFAGWAATTSKYLKKTITALDGSSRTLKWVKLTNNVVAFGDRRLLRKVLGLGSISADPRVAHHLIPWDHGIDDLVQKATQSTNPFHLNELLNGLPLTAIQHNSGGHALYNQKVKTKLTQLWNSNGQAAMTPQTAEALVRSLANDIKTWILAHPNESINNIIL